MFAVLVLLVMLVLVALGGSFLCLFFVFAAAPAEGPQAREQGTPGRSGARA